MKFDFQLNIIILFYILILLRLWLIAILIESNPMKNMKLFMLNVDIVPVSMEVKMPNFRIAFADSNSNAKSNPLIKLFFVILLLFTIRSLSWSASENLEVIESDLIVVFRRGTILKDTETPITIIANTSMNEV